MSDPDVDFINEMREFNESKKIHTQECIDYNMKWEHDTPGECICDEQCLRYSWVQGND